MPSAATLAGMYGVQVVLSYVVPSGSGQAALSLPILVPLGDLVGVTRQTSVLAYQLGDGFSNTLTPTQGYFMAALALAGIPGPAGPASFGRSSSPGWSRGWRSSSSPTPSAGVRKGFKTLRVPFRRVRSSAGSRRRSW